MILSFNWIKINDKPWLELDLISFILGERRNWFSKGSVINVSIRAALAPGYGAIILTKRLVRCGFSVWGITNHELIPAARITIIVSHSKCWLRKYNVTKELFDSAILLLCDPTITKEKGEENINKIKNILNSYNKWKQ